MKKCKHLDELFRLGFISYGQLENQGNFRQAIILREIKEGKSGHLSVGRNWVEVKYCPLCGINVDEEGE